MATTLSSTFDQNNTSQRRGFSILGRNGRDVLTSHVSNLDQTTPSMASVTESSADKIADINNNLTLDRYKTELCHHFQENGFCKYAAKCKFAHAQDELRSVSRHPKYKTEICRTYHMTGFCRYGIRCHFKHDQEEPQRCRKRSLFTDLSNIQVTAPMSPWSPDATHSSSPVLNQTTTTAQTQLATPEVFIPLPTRRSSYPDDFQSTTISNTSGLLNVDAYPIESLVAGLKAAVPCATSIVQDCLLDMYFIPASPVCQADVSDMTADVSSRLPVFSELCNKISM